MPEKSSRRFPRAGSMLCFRRGVSHEVDAQMLLCDRGYWSRGSDEDTSLQSCGDLSQFHRRQANQQGLVMSRSRQTVSTVRFETKVKAVDASAVSVICPAWPFLPRADDRPSRAGPICDVQRSHNLHGDLACLLLVFFGTNGGIVMYSGEDGFQNADPVCGVGRVRGDQTCLFPVCGHGCERRVTGCIASRHEQVST